MPRFSIHYVPPDPPAAFVATGMGAYVALTWDQTYLGGDEFDNYTLTRSLDGGVTWETLAKIENAGQVSYDDYLAPIDRLLLYRLTQTNLLGFTSEPAEAEARLSECGWWIIMPGFASSFEIPNVTAYNSAWPNQFMEHEPIGRDRKLVESGLLLGEEGVITAYLEPQHDPTVVNLLHAAADVPEVMFKTPYGDVFMVSLGSLTRERQPGGYQEVSFRYVAV